MGLFVWLRAKGPLWFGVIIRFANGCQEWSSVIGYCLDIG
jgi:hypothetical protein